MQKLDRLGWATGIAFRAYGLRVGIRTNLPELPAQLVSMVPARAKLLPAGSRVEHLYGLRFAENQLNARFKRFHLATFNAQVIARSLDSNQVMMALERELHRFLAEFSRKEIFVHAAVVGWKGEAIVIPGASSSGKSTLAAALVKAGATYYSDEFAVLDPSGKVRPFPRPISLREDGGRAIRRVPADALGGRIGRKPLAVRAVWLTKFDPAGRWRPREISTGQALLGLLAHTVQARTRTKEVLRTLRRVVLQASSMRGRRGEAEELVNFLHKRPVA